MTDRILIIEAEPFLRKGLISAFAEAGFAVENVPDCPEALLKIDEFKPDIIIMDAVLPVETVWGLALNYTAPVIFLSS